MQTWTNASVEPRWKAEMAASVSMLIRGQIQCGSTLQAAWPSYTARPNGFRVSCTGKIEKKKNYPGSETLPALINEKEACWPYVP